MNPHLAYQRPDPARLSRNPAFIARVMARWAEKQDTTRIAAELMTVECVVANALAAGRDQKQGEA